MSSACDSRKTNAQFIIMLVGSDNDCMVPRLLSRADKSISSSSAQEDILYEIVLVAWTEKKELDCV